MNIYHVVCHECGLEDLYPKRGEAVTRWKNHVDESNHNISLGRIQ